MDGGGRSTAGRDPPPLGALDIRDQVRSGRMSVLEVVEDCLARVEATAEFRAWAHVDPQHALEQARHLDRRRGAGLPLGPLHGVPVAIKDIIDTRDMPTGNGTALDEGRRPSRDATLVSRLRAAGAVILGKTVTTELAFSHPSETRNPRDPSRSPGGSSSGSAAAVAAGAVPVAVGTQTNGSVIRPAAFCGVVGYKPSFGRISRAGVLRHAPSLDTVGVFGRTIEDVALAAEAMFGFDPEDDATPLEAHDPLGEIARARPPVRPCFAFVRTPFWDHADPDMRGAVAELAAELGSACEPFDLPDGFAEAHRAHRRIMVVGFARNLRAYRDRGSGVLSLAMREAIAEGEAASAVDYLASLGVQRALRVALEPLFDRFDALITPAAAGEAPAGFETTGSPVFNTIWTLCGCPAVSLPLAEGASGMPLGIQVVGRPGYDGRLLRTARWLHDRVLSGAEPGTGRHGET